MNDQQQIINNNIASNTTTISIQQSLISASDLWKKLKEKNVYISLITTDSMTPNIHNKTTTTTTTKKQKKKKYITSFLYFVLHSRVYCYRKHTVIQKYTIYWNKHSTHTHTDIHRNACNHKHH